MGPGDSPEWCHYDPELNHNETDAASSYPYSSGLLHQHWGNHMIAPVLVKWPWRIWANKAHESVTQYIRVWLNIFEGCHSQKKAKHDKSMNMFYGIYYMCDTLFQPSSVQLRPSSVMASLWGRYQTPCSSVHIRLFHDPTRTTSSGCRDMEQTSVHMGSLDR